MEGARYSNVRSGLTECERVQCCESREDVVCARMLWKTEGILSNVGFHNS